MSANTFLKLLELRYIVGFLGEKEQFCWWQSSFLNTTSKRMLEFTFPRTSNLAQYQAVSAAAAKVHDESIGVGKSFHLFRLPEFLEKLLVEELQNKGSAEYESLISSREDALSYLSELSRNESLTGEGPINVGVVSNAQWDKSITRLAAGYLQAFEQGHKAYPYFQGDI